MPEKLKQETSKLILNWDANKYTHPMWIVELRKKVSEFYKSYYNSNFSKDEIVITARAIEAINSLLLTKLTNENDEVILLDPSYASYNNAIKIAWWKLIYCPTEKDLINSRHIVLEELEKLTDYIEFEKPKAWYYIFCKLKYTNDDYNECLKILKEAKVSLVPGSAFWKTWKWYFRICFWRKSSTLKTWLKRLNKYFYNRKK